LLEYDDEEAAVPVKDDWFQDLIATGEDEDEDEDELDNSDPDSDDGSTIMGSYLRSVASTNFSMTSSAIFRNQGLTMLDDRFDTIEEEYAQSDDDDDDSDYIREKGEREPQATPQLDISRFDAIMDEFLQGQSVVGKKLVRKPNPIADMDELRQTLHNV